MADIRINALATTATSAASDDYLALDGSANGTRKILATNVAQNVTDVTFGASGPSAKSSINARAARQGLVFDGTSNGSFSALSAFGSGDFTYAAWVYVPATVSAYGPGLIGGGTNSFTLRIYDNLKLQSTLVDIGDNAQSTKTVNAGKWNFVSYRRTGTSGYYGINGVEDSPITDSKNYSVGCTLIGQVNAGYGANYIWNGSISGSYIYNRALSASEVVSLFEAGVPSAADYNSASSSSIVSGAWVKNAGTGTFTSTAADNLTVNISDALNAQASTTFSVRPGQKIALRGSFASITGGASVFLYDGSFISTSTALTSTGAEITATAASSSAQIYITSGGAVSFTGTSISVVRLGLLLAPDAGQAGGGLTWYDTSGNAANITLPASGVAWAVPTSGNVTSGSALNLRAGGTNQNVTLVPSGNGLVSITGGTGTQTVGFNKSGGNNFYLSVVSSADESLRFQNSGGTNLVEFNKNGNLLVGTTTDGGQKLQVNGTGYLSDSLRVGTSFTPTAWGVKAIEVNDAGGGLFATYYGGSPKGYMLGLSNGLRFNGHSSSSRIDIMDAGSIILATNNTTALTLDSSQRTILAGALRLNNAYTAGAPTATGYVTLEDSAGNTYKVLVGT